MRNLGRIFLPLAILGSALAEDPAVSVAQPNIVLLFVDDLGWSDLGHRNPKFESPEIDRLAREGLSFEQAYIPCPTCSPSRATLMTGKHPARLGMVRHIPTAPGKHGFDKQGRIEEEFNQWPGDPARFPSRNWLQLDHVTYAEALGERGYYNLFVGKWHLGHEAYHPIHQGFDQQIGTSNWGHPKSYYPRFFAHSDVFEEVEDRYLTDKLTDEAVGFIEGYKDDRPFMISQWYYSVHGPHIGRRDLVRHFEEKGLVGKEAQYAAMIKAVDESVGRIRAALEERELEEKTLIIFLSDQGGFFENPPFRGGKRVDTLCEGGARVPFFVHWPGVTRAGAKNQSVVQSTDLFPTLVEIAGGRPEDFSELDGTSLVKTLREGSVLKRGAPIFGYRAYEDLYASVRSGDWKLLGYRSGKLELHQLADDPEEAVDVSGSHPEKTSQLLEQLVAWEKKMGVDRYSGFPRKPTSGSR